MKTALVVAAYVTAVLADDVERGRCTPRIAAGGNCLNAREACAEGLVCDEADRCTSELPREGEPCLNGVDCAAGLACSDTFNGVCTSLPAPGEPCALGTFGFILCADMDVNGCLAGTCGALPTEGQECTRDNRCASGLGLGCVFSPEGAFCKKTSETTRCENNDACSAGLYCDFSEGSCVPELREGDKCKFGNECAAPLECRETSSWFGRKQFKCKMPALTGDNCLFSNECTPENYCRWGPDAVETLMPTTAVPVPPTPTPEPLIAEPTPTTAVPLPPTPEPTPEPLIAEPTPTTAVPVPPTPTPEPLIAEPTPTTAVPLPPTPEPTPEPPSCFFFWCW